MTLNNRIKMIQNNQEQFIVEMKETQKQQKQVEYIKAELDGLLWAELMESNNIFDDEIKAIVIDTCMNNSDVLLYNKDYTRQYLNKHYYTIARQVEQIKKKTSEDTNRQQQLKNDILEIKKQQEAEKLKKLQQQNVSKQAQQVQKNQTNWAQVVGIIASIIFLPIGFIILCILSAAKNQK